MNILFLTLIDFYSLTEKGIYTDLLRVFTREGHRVSVISPVERRHKQRTHLICEEHCQILKLRIGNTQKTNIMEKGVSTMLLQSQYKAAVKKYFSDKRFDLVLYSTPPITFANVIDYVKKRDGALSYLLLKDIFPQNAVDLAMFSEKSVFYSYFRHKEKKLYQISDYIGCMSKANVRYLLAHNEDVGESKVHICPNTIEPTKKALTGEEKKALRKAYSLPQDKKIFVYGGNLGKPQGIDFLLACLRREKENGDVFFLIIGSGTDYEKIERYCQKETPANVRLIRQMPREAFDALAHACDVGMIFLDRRFTIPNFPSRLLSYMDASLPTLAVTDVHTDVGEVLTESQSGWFCESGQLEDFAATVQTIVHSDTEAMGRRSKQYLLEHYTARAAYEIIMGCLP